MGTIADKLTYLNETKTMLRESLNKLGADILDNATFRSYLTHLDNLYNGLFNLTNMSKNGIVGRTSQEGTPSPSTPQEINDLSGDITYSVSSDEQSIPTRDFTISLKSDGNDIHLNKIGTYQDKIYSKDNKFYLYKENNYIVLNGSESWNFVPVGQDLYTLEIDDYLKTTDWICYCNYYSGSNNTNNTMLPGVNQCCFDTGTSSRFKLRDTSYRGNVESFKTWLSTHNVELCYVLNTPTTTEITSTSHPTLYNQLKEIQDYLIKYKVNNELILGYGEPNIEY